MRDLVASQPGPEGKRFAAAKDSGLYELAIELANRSPLVPQKLIRAARDFTAERPEFALAAGMTALRGIAHGWGYDITGIDVLDAYAAVMAAAGAAGGMRLWSRPMRARLFQQAAVAVSLLDGCRYMWRPVLERAGITVTVTFTHQALRKSGALNDVFRILEGTRTSGHNI